MKLPEPSQPFPRFFQYEIGDIQIETSELPEKPKEFLQTLDNIMKEGMDSVKCNSYSRLKKSVADITKLLRVMGIKSQTLSVNASCVSFSTTTDPSYTDAKFVCVRWQADEFDYILQKWSPIIQDYRTIEERKLKYQEVLEVLLNAPW